ncbi:hypothetical protein RvY_08469 [Ramazzottius varieornatus]|uniref:Metalloendopeptidase n=1 Tax=Ramazzottius varieornatus TaxID=947166 RepID=A0A1D1V5V4_RAMVA|nr:hypothetical protein RvY_08469 [Ramazzottius varieornatus]
MLRDLFPVLSPTISLFFITLAQAQEQYGAGLDAIFEPGSPIEARTLNSDKSFSRWPKRSRIPYVINPRYSPIESSLIRAAINQIMADLNYWVTFAAVKLDSAEFKIHITPLRADNKTFESMCYSFPGMLSSAPRMAASGMTEQRLVIARGPTGCLDGTLHSIMKNLIVVLGKRNEHQRGDRDKFIEIYPGNITTDGRASYRKYSPSEASWQLFPYDYCSITHQQQSDHALPGTVAFSVLEPPYFIPKLNRLSEYDCRLILILYGGDPSACSKLNCSALALPTKPEPKPAAMLVLSTTASTAVPSTTTTAFLEDDATVSGMEIPNAGPAFEQPSVIAQPTPQTALVSSTIGSSPNRQSAKLPGTVNPTVTHGNGITTVCYHFPSFSTSAGVPGGSEVNIADSTGNRLGPNAASSVPSTTEATSAPSTARKSTAAPSTTRRSTAKLTTTPTTTTTATTTITTTTTEPTTTETTKTTTTEIETTPEPTTEVTAEATPETPSSTVETIGLRQQAISVECAGVNFCSTKVDQVSMYMDGETSILFSGNCTQRIDKKFTLLGSPKPIHEALPHKNIFAPLKAVWTDLQDGRYRLHVIDRNGIQRGCSMDNCEREVNMMSIAFPTRSVFAVQAGQTSIFRMFSVNEKGTGVRDLAKPTASIPIDHINGNQASSRLARISGGWMYYGQDGEGTVSLIGLDKDGTQYVGDVVVDLTRVPAYFTLKSNSAAVPLSNLLHPCD